MRSLPLLGGPPVTTTPPSPIPVLRKGFRPFFLLGAALAVLLVPLWILVLRGVVPLGTYLDPMAWHAHEMIFGFVVAVIAGFLLTAVGSWTQRETATGWPLALLAALWIAGRIALLSPWPRWLVAVIDLSFLPMLAATLGRPIVLTKNHRNLVMVGAVSALWLSNLAIHLDALGLVLGYRRRGATVALDVITLLIVIIAGRVVPMFTRNATGDDRIQSNPWADKLALGAVFAVTLLDVSSPEPGLVHAAAYGLAAVIVIARTVPWGTRRVWRDPLLWILHVGHAWIPVGLLLRALSVLDATVPTAVGTHALTAGAVGAMTLGMMARVSLGHSGRPLRAPRGVALAFVLVTLAAVVRVSAQLFLPSLYRGALVAAAAAWAAAFGIFIFVYAPVLLAPRVDGKPG